MYFKCYVVVYVENASIQSTNQTDLIVGTMFVPIKKKSLKKKSEKSGFFKLS